MKTLSKIGILLLVGTTIFLSSCTLGASVIKRNDGFAYNNASQNNALVYNIPEKRMN